MSIRERIEATAQKINNQDLLIQLEADRQREKQLQIEERLMREEGVALSKQRHLLEKLRSIGVVGMIEEATGTNFPRIGEDVDNSYSPWTVSFKGPVPLPDGTWYTGVDLDIERILDVGANRGRTSLVELAYTQTGRLTIKGQDTTYNDVVRRRSPKQTHLIEDALVRAFSNPRIY